MERVGDIYFGRDFPVLASIAQWEEQGRANRHLRPETIADELKRPVRDVIQSLGRLYHAGLVDYADASTMGGDYYMVRRLTAAGLQESGLWPRPTDLSTALADVLRHEIQTTARSEPERSQKLQVVLDTVTDLGAGFAAKFAAELLKILTAPHKTLGLSRASESGRLRERGSMFLPEDGSA